MTIWRNNLSSMIRSYEVNIVLWMYLPLSRLKWTHYTTQTQTNGNGWKHKLHFILAATDSSFLPSSDSPSSSSSRMVGSSSAPPSSFWLEGGRRLFRKFIELRRASVCRCTSSEEKFTWGQVRGSRAGFKRLESKHAAIAEKQNPFQIYCILQYPDQKVKLCFTFLFFCTYLSNA